MTGLDRAAVWCELEIDADLATVGIRKKYPAINPKKLSGNTQTYIINSENINEIRIKEKYYKTMIKVDFSYSKKDREDNLYPLTSELGKIIIEERIIKLIEEITLEKIERHQLFYEYFEYAIQEEIESFYSYYNIVSCFYRGLTREISNKKNSNQFNNYDSDLDYFYSTGFIYQVQKGWKIRLYSKTHEHNKKDLEKVNKPIIRLEHRLNQSVIKRFLGTNNVEALTLEYIEKKLDGIIGIFLFKILKKEIKRDIEILLKNFKEFESRKLESLVRNNQEHILDEKIIDLVIEKLSKKSDRQNRRYKTKINEVLKNCQTRGSPKRDNFGNIKRLEFFIKNILKTKIKLDISIKSVDILSFNLNGHNYVRF